MDGKTRGASFRAEVEARIEAVRRAKERALSAGRKPGMDDYTAELRDEAGVDSESRRRLLRTRARRAKGID